jgi:hypothetical protein
MYGVIIGRLRMLSAMVMDERTLTDFKYTSCSIFLYNACVHAQ